MNNENGRRHYSPAEKVKILRRHLLDGVPISEESSDS
jgi:DNA-binding transcriptional MerR regulator